MTPETATKSTTTTSVRKSTLPVALFGLAAITFLAVGFIRARADRNDFRPVFAGCQCILHFCNPYADGVLLYPPSTLLALSPLALLSYKTALTLWLLLNGALYILAVVLMVSLSPSKVYRQGVILGAAFLAGSSKLLMYAQPSAFAISLVAIGFSLLLRGRRLSMGAALIAVSLAVKPQIGGFIVLFLFLRGIHRRHAALAMAGATVLLVLGALLLSGRPTSVNWRSDLSRNVANATRPGATDDLRPSGESAFAAVNLQTITSIFLSDEKQYNLAAYLLSGALLAVWAAAAFRMKANEENYLLAVAALSAITLLPVYHRGYDTGLLMLSIPATLLVLQSHRVIGLVLCVLEPLSQIALQYRLHLLLEHFGRLRHLVEGNKLFFIIGLREGCLTVTFISCLLVMVIVRRAFFDGSRYAAEKSVGEYPTGVAALEHIA
jgi:hypothetical protein